jgi:hypothetical protein
MFVVWCNVWLENLAIILIISFQTFIHSFFFDLPQEERKILANGKYLCLTCKSNASLSAIFISQYLLTSSQHQN